MHVQVLHTRVQKEIFQQSWIQRFRWPFALTIIFFEGGAQHDIRIYEFYC